MKEICQYCGVEYGTRVPRGGCKHCLCRICGLLRKRTKADVPVYCECPVFRPATAIWFAKEHGREWCEKHVPSLFKRFGTAPVCGIYVIEFDGIPLYIGRAVDITPRLIGHAYVLHTEPEFFGLTHEEVEDLSSGVRISMRVLEECEPDECSDREIYNINEIRPLLQLGGNTDRCIPRSNRRGVVLREINKSE